MAGPLADLGPWEPAQRYWHGNDPEFDVVARSVDGVRTLVGEAKWGKRAANPQRGSTDILPGATGSKVVRVLFVPCADTVSGTAENTHIVDAGAVMTALRGDS